MSSSQLTNIFQRGRSITNQLHLLDPQIPIDIPSGNDVVCELEHVLVERNREFSHEEIGGAFQLCKRLPQGGAPLVIKWVLIPLTSSIYHQQKPNLLN